MLQISAISSCMTFSRADFIIIRAVESCFTTCKVTTKSETWKDIIRIELPCSSYLDVFHKKLYLQKITKEAKSSLINRIQQDSLVMYGLEATMNNDA